MAHWEKEQEKEETVETETVTLKENCKNYMITTTYQLADLTRLISLGYEDLFLGWK